MGKILLICRVSTDAQELDEQRNELIDFAKSKGYQDDDIILLEGVGASAIKLNDKYIELVDKIKEYVSNRVVECVACWHLNRLGRNDRVLIELKNYFIDNKVQFICKNPYLQLLDADGSVNAGAELAYGLFATMVKQDMAEKSAKFKRTKRAYAPKGMYCGGTGKRYGYKVVNKYFVPDEYDGEIVKLIFQLYSTGNYSYYSLAEELNKRGYKKSKGESKFYAYYVGDILESSAYYGAPMEKHNNRVYPPLISKELFDKCAEIREKNKIMVRKKSDDEKPLAARLIRCTQCGCLYLSDGLQYKCCKHSKKESIYCPNNLCIQKKLMDKLVWRVASIVHLEFLMSMSDEKLEEYTNEIEVIDKKINTITNNINGVQKKKQRVIDTFVEGLIDKENRDLKLNKINEEAVQYQRELNSLNEAKNNLIKLIESYQNKDEVESFINSMNTLGTLDKYDVIHKQIRLITLDRMQLILSDKTIDNAIKITINTATGGVWQFCYLRYAKKIPVYIWNGSEWLPDYAE